MNWLKSFWQRLSTPLPREHVQASDALANFTPRANKVLSLAREEAERFRHDFVGTEHVLLGLIRLGQGMAFTVLGKMGVDLEAARREVEQQVGAGPERKVVGSTPYTPRVKKMLALAAKEARVLNHTYVGTEHILLGLLREGEGVAGRVLKRFEVDTDLTRQHILRELDPNFSPAPDGAGASQMPRSEPLDPEKVDLRKRYDVHCREGEQQVVYRNVLFIGVKTLFKRREYETFSEFLEIEQADGKTILIARSSVIKFCENGVTPGCERT
jgi:ATP-dependent Clp protease ATP-binding subunit ClpA